MRGQLQRGQGEVRGAIRKGQDWQEAGRLQGQISESLQVSKLFYLQVTIGNNAVLIYPKVTK